jgi:tRNA G18 (ribose-2'-O)-methylase SpoU
MPRIPIDDLEDPRIAVYRSLKATNRTRDLDQFVVEGERLVARLLDSRFPIVSVLLSDRYEGRLTRPIPGHLPVYVVSSAMIDQVVGFPFHRGILGCGERRPWPSLEELVADPGRPFFAVICPKISNPENLGAIARIGDVFGIDAILAGPECPDPLSRRVLRVSMGAVLRLPVLVLERPVEAARGLAASAGFELLAAVADPAAEPFEGVPRPRRLALVLGDEHEGVDPEWLALCHRAATIPMRPGASSLNVAVAAGILMYHFSRVEGGG